MIGHDDVIPVCFSSEILGGRDKERNHGPCAYCNDFSCLALTLAAGAGPGGRRLIRRPSTRSSPVTNSAVPTGRPVLSAHRRAAKASLSILQEQVRKAGDAIEHRTDCHQAIIFPRQMGSYARPRPISRFPGQARSHGIQVDVGDRRQHMQFVHSHRSKPALKEVARPAPRALMKLV
jgi:hypothetical protein